jgi:tRNA pseudouridine38-40 synthase
VQKTGTRAKPTIQGTLERVLSQILQEPVRVLGSGRTDAGVHALAQVAHLRTRSQLPRERLLRSVNALLPPDIAVMRIEAAPEGFHAQFQARSKRYRYRIFTGPVVPPFIRPYVHHVRVPLNVGLMRREAAALAGRHDVRAFARAGSGRSETVRTIRECRVVRRNQELHVEVEADGFLRTMVRSLVGTLLDIGRGRLPPGRIRALLRRGSRELAGTTAPARGLALVSVSY